MTLQTLFGPEEITSKSRTIKFKQIKAVYETLIVREEVADYLKTGNRYTAPRQVFDTFSFLMKETGLFSISSTSFGAARMAGGLFPRGRSRIFWHTTLLLASPLPSWMDTRSSVVCILPRHALMT